LESFRFPSSVRPEGGNFSVADTILPFLEVFFATFLVAAFVHTAAKIPRHILSLPPRILKDTNRPGNDRQSKQEPSLHTVITGYHRIGSTGVSGAARFMLAVLDEAGGTD
jgi:hypothetical protein